jgi:hypothetical protein
MERPLFDHPLLALMPDRHAPVGAPGLRYPPLSIHRADRGVSPARAAG